MEVRACDSHTDYITPLISTMAYRGAEYWCPHCGFTCGVMWADHMVELTPELKKRVVAFKRISADFLTATGRKSCRSTKYKGEWIDFKDIPQECWDEGAAHIKAWRYGQKPDQP